MLKNETLGSFIVRESTTRSGCFALSLRVPSEFQSTGIAHYLILRTGKGFKIKVRSNNGEPIRAEKLKTSFHCLVVRSEELLTQENPIRSKGIHKDSLQVEKFLGTKKG